MERLHDAARNGRTDLVREYHRDGVNKRDHNGKIFRYIFFILVKIFKRPLLISKIFNIISIYKNVMHNINYNFF